MGTTATDCRRVKDQWPPYGTYEGTWGGYVVKFFAKGRQYEARTKVGIRTLAASVVVIVKPDEIQVELKS